LQRIAFLIIRDLQDQFNNFYHIIIITKTKTFLKEKRKTFATILSKIITMLEDDCYTNAIQAKEIKNHH
jgi:hypothetical protein